MLLLAAASGQGASPAGEQSPPGATPTRPRLPDSQAVSEARTRSESALVRRRRLVDSLNAAHESSASPLPTAAKFALSLLATAFGIAWLMSLRFRRLR